MQFPEEDSRRPAIKDNVMHGDDQDMLLRRQAQQAPSDQRSTRQVEGPVRFFTDQASQMALSFSRCMVLQVPHRQRPALEWRNNLDRISIDRQKGCAQNFMAPNDLIERLSQRGRLN